MLYPFQIIISVELTQCAWLWAQDLKDVVEIQNILMDMLSI